jgi:cation transport regulator ChaB
VVADGAPWIWNLASEHFYDSAQVVDWSHAKSHLAHAAQLLYGEGTNMAQRWPNDQETRLFQGQAEGVADMIRDSANKNAANAVELLTEAGYFESNKRRMEYLDRRMEG